jgi:hypothetical protein
MPRLEKEIWEQFQEHDFEMIAIAREQTNREIEEFNKKFNYSFPMSPDPERAIYNKFADAGIPRNYVINSCGKIIYQSCGYTPDDFEKMTGIIATELNKLKR